MDMVKYFPLVKVDETTHRAMGLVTAEVPDKEGEICDYEAAKQSYVAWSDEAFMTTKTAGQDISYGNIRLQHGMQIGGKVAVPPIFRDDTKEIYLDTEPKDEVIFSDLKRGFYRGFSQGGSYIFRKCADCGTPIDPEQGRNCPKCQTVVFVRYAPRIAEVSYVDNPCLRAAHFTLVKADGAEERCEFLKSAAERSTPMENEAAKAVDEAAVERIIKNVLAQIRKAEEKTKRVAGEDLNASCFAYVGDKEDTSTWKYPIKFSTDEKTASHIRNAISRWHGPKGQASIPEGERNKVYARIKAAAKEHDIDVADEEKKCEMARKAVETSLVKALAAKLGEAAVTKNMQSIGDMANILWQMQWLRDAAQWEATYEGGTGDPKDAAIAEDALIQDGITILKDIVEDETSELTASAAAKSNKGEDLMKIETGELSKAARKSLADHLDTMKSAVTEHHQKCVKAHQDHADAMCEAHKAHCDKMHKMHKAHHDAMHDHLGKLHKILGAEEADAIDGTKGGNEPADIDPEKQGTESHYGKAEFDALTARLAQLEKAQGINEEAVILAVIKAIADPEADGEDDGEKKLAKKADGIGDRTAPLPGAGPVLKVMPVTKADDNGGGGADKSEGAKPEDFAKAIAGDRDASLRFMKGVRALSEVPSTLAPALSKAR